MNVQVAHASDQSSADTGNKETGLALAEKEENRLSKQTGNTNNRQGVSKSGTKQKIGNGNSVHEQNKYDTMDSEFEEY